MKLTGLRTLLAAGLLLVNSSINPEIEQSQNETGFSCEKADSFIHEKVTIDPIERENSYSAVLYNNRNGLPTSEANVITETRDGFIWIGSYSGLIRYDGNTFERIDSTTGIANVGSLFVDSKDRLWIGTNDAGVYLMEKGQTRRWNEADGLRALKICNMAEDDNGIVYVSSTAGIYMFDEDLNMTSIEDPRITDMYIDVLVADSEGTIYGVSNQDEIFTIRNGAVDKYFKDTDYEISGVINLLPDPDHPGYVYLGTGDSDFYYGYLGDELTIEKKYDITPLASVMGLKQIDGRIWISGRNGIGVLQGDEFLYLDDVPMDNSVGCIMEDYEGNIWFTSTRQGVMKIVPNQFSDLFERFELDEEVVNTTCMNTDGNLLIGTDSGLIVLNKEKGRIYDIPITSAVSASGEVVETGNLVDYLDGARIRSIIRDSKDRMWIATWRALGLLCYDHGKLTTYNKEDGMLSTHFRAVDETEDGTILVANTGGVSLIKDGAVIKSYGEEDGITNPETLTVEEAPNGDILVGSDGGGIFIVHDDSVRCVSTRDGLSSGIVMRIKYDKRRHLFWIVTSNSLSYMTEDYKVTTLNKFPYSNNFDLFENSHEEMWILSSNGIYVLPTAELLANNNVNPIHYSIDNGLPCIATANSYSELTEDGVLYIAGNSGVTSVNVEEPVENVLDLKISVPYVEIDGQRIYPESEGKFHLPHAVHKLTIFGYVFNYSLTNPTVLYKLEGFDTDYVKVNRSDFSSVNYTNLPGGTYRFVIRLKDSQGHTGKTVSVTIVKDKALYEQTWFYVLSAISGIILIVLGIWLYIRRKTRILEEKNREEIKKELLNTELNTAGQIQESMLPHEFPPFPDHTEFDIYASMTPARAVGGDFYDFFLIDDNHLCMIMADVSGKGIPAALYMMISKVILQNCAMLGHSASEILTQTNEILCTRDQVDLFVTVWVGILDLRTGIVTAANAGHEYPALKRNGTFELLKDKHGFVVGGMEGAKYTEYEFRMEPGDIVFVYTDGVPEATNADNQMFGTDRMLTALNAHKDKEPKEILEGVHLAVDDFVQDAEQFDDLTMMCMKFIKKQESEEET